ncbi:hypothetical protein FRC06_006564 [Ceratobasidium sp. 370]|nr:hypothetical protein FRC06_006564 [Ceratobasidium sp. 370]
MLAEPSLMNWGGVVNLLPYGERWRKSRRIMHQWLHKEASVAFQPSQQHQARLLLQRLLNKSERLDSSEELELESYRTMAGTIMYSTYGWKVEDTSDIFMLKAKKAVEHMTRGVLASNFMVNAFPILNRIPDWFPWTGWKSVAKAWREAVRDAVNSPYNWTKAEMGKFMHEPSMVESMLGQTQRLGMDSSEADDYIKEIAFILFADVQAKAQHEIDLVIGSNRLPTMEDRAQLPYIERLIEELLRWRPIAPNGAPHVCYKDDIYKGYHIPKGAIVLGNIWAMSHNDAVYKDPETFEPDRFLDPSVPSPPAFGFGRRVCPGIHYAKSSLFICLASILATFDIKMAKDVRGDDIVPGSEAENDLLYRPIPFKFRLVPRSPLHAQLIRAGA